MQSQEVRMASTCHAARIQGSIEPQQPPQGGGDAQQQQPLLVHLHPLLLEWAQQAQRCHAEFPLATRL